MAVLIGIGIMVLLIGGIYLLSYLISYLIIFISNLLKKTILKKYEYERILKQVHYRFGFNKEMIKFYKGEIDSLSPQYENEIGICYCFESWDYLKEIGIDEKLIEEGIKSEEEAMSSYEIYSERKRREDIESRIQFIEKELKDIKRRI